MRSRVFSAKSNTVITPRIHHVTRPSTYKLAFTRLAPHPLPPPSIMSRFFSRFQQQVHSATGTPLDLCSNAPTQNGSSESTKAIKELKDGNTGLPFHMEYSGLAAGLDFLKDPNAIDDRKMLVRTLPCLGLRSRAYIRPSPAGIHPHETFRVSCGKSREEIGANYCGNVYVLPFRPMTFTGS